MTLIKPGIHGSLVLLAALLACGDSGGGSEGTADNDTTVGATSGGGATDEGSTADAPTSADTTAAPGTSSETGETTAGPGTETAPETTDAPDTTDAPETTDEPETTGGVADCGFDPGVVYGRTAPVFQLVSADGETCVWLLRQDLSEPDIIYKAVPYKLLELKAGHAGVVDHLTDQAQMTWESTHHNWTDVAEAWNEGVRYRLEDWYAKDGAFIDMYGLYAYDEQTDALLWGPVELVPYVP